MVVALALTACGDGEDARAETATASPDASSTPEAATATPVPTAGPTPAESGGEDGFRAFAVQIEAALDAADGSFFAGRGLEEDLVCAGDEELGPCAGQAAGTAFRGIPRGIFQSDAFFLTSPAEYEADLQEWFAGDHPELDDDYGNGAVALWALAYKAAERRGEEAHQAIITAIATSGGDSVRQARTLSFRFVDGRWRLTGEIAANLPQTADAYLSGECDYCYDRWERWEGAGG